MQKKTILIAASDLEKADLISKWVSSKIENVLVYTASNEIECFQKIRNARPDLLITDFRLTKSTSVQTVASLIQDPDYAKLPVIVFGGKSDKLEYIDASITGKVQFVDTLGTEADFLPFVNRALNFAQALAPSKYDIRNLITGETLIQEGQIADHVYILKKGKLVASRIDGGSEVVLGEISPGEFVGEMSFLNQSKRVATVKALEDSQVVSLPIEVFERVIFQRPAWAKVILSTLSRRLGQVLKR